MIYYLFSIHFKLAIVETTWAYLNNLIQLMVQITFKHCLLLPLMTYYYPSGSGTRLTIDTIRKQEHPTVPDLQHLTGTATKQVHNPNNNNILKKANQKWPQNKTWHHQFWSSSQRESGITHSTNLIILINACITLDSQ